MSLLVEKKRKSVLFNFYRSLLSLIFESITQQKRSNERELRLRISVTCACVDLAYISALMLAQLFERARVLVSETPSILTNSLTKRA